MTWIRHHRLELTASLASGNLTFDELVDEYPTDATLAFNRLPTAGRSALITSLVDEGRPRLPSGVKRSQTNAPLEIKFAHWAKETLYLVVHFDRPTGWRPLAIPVGLEYVETDRTAPEKSRHRRARAFEELRLVAETAGIDLGDTFTLLEVKNDLIYVAPRTAAGDWLFAMRAPRATVETCVVGPLVRYSQALYRKPLELDSE